MKLVVISPEEEDPREGAVLEALLRAGLERYHVRKPAWPSDRLGAWLAALPAACRPRLVLHSHHHWVGTLGLGGRHWRDDATARAVPGPGYSSRSCHDLAGLTTALGAYTSVFFGPVFPSLSKPGHGPGPDETAMMRTLAERSSLQRQTTVLALGGVTLDRLARCRDLGYDGAAVLGAIWQSAEPVEAFLALQAAAKPIPVLI